MLESLFTDALHAVRGLRREPGWSAAAILTLAVAIGATTAVYGLVDGILLRPLAFDEPQDLVILEARRHEPMGPDVSERTAAHIRYNMTWGGYEAWRSLTADVFADLGAYDDTWDLTVRGDDFSERMGSMLITASALRALRLRPLVGRAFNDGDDEEGAPPVVMLGHDFWQRRFAGDTGVVGMSLRIQGEPHQVIGVLPPDIEIGERDAQVWMPMAGAERGPGSFNYEVIGRLRDGLSLGDAEAVLAGRQVDLESSDGETFAWSVAPVSLRTYRVGETGGMLIVFLAAVGAVLVIACVNVTNLVLARVAVRHREQVIRAALGASRARRARQHLTESMVVAVLGGLSGAFVAYGLTAVLIRIVPVDVPRIEAVGVNGGVLAFNAAVVLFVGLAVGLLPALAGARAKLAEGFGVASRSTSGGTGMARVRDGLVVMQLALTLMLLICAALLGRSFIGMFEIEHGFDSSDVLAFETALPREQYPDFASRSAYYSRLLQEIEALPGVTSAALSAYLPSSGWFTSVSFDVPGYAPAEGEQLEAELKPVSGSFFSTLRIAVRAGRTFEASDTDAAPVVVVNRTFAERYFRGDAVGREVILRQQPRRIVGVVDDVRFRAGGRNRGDVARLQIYVPFHDDGRARDMDVLVRAGSPPGLLAGPLRQVATRIEPLTTVFGMTTVERLLAGRVAGPRFRTLILGAFGSVALFLSLVGIYGVMAYGVAQRMRELGIRLALGATQRRVFLGVMGRSALLAAWGLAGGLVGAWAVTGALEGYLYGLGVRDLPTFAGAATVLALAAVAAAIVPGRRATRVDPMVALRAD